MTNGKMLTKKQRAVIEDLFTGGADEQHVLDRHKIGRRVYEKWQADEVFQRAFDIRLQKERRQSEVIIARYATVAAMKLVQLTDSQNPETARKACLDIINLLGPSEERPSEDPAEKTPDLSPELTSRLLTVLAENEGDKRSDQ